MNIPDALKAVAPAVGDGKLVWQHAFTLFDGPTLRVCNGKMWAGASLDEVFERPIYARHESLLYGMSREGAELIRNDDNVVMKAGRSRVKLKLGDATTFPPEPTARSAWTVPAVPGFKDTLRDLTPFCGSQDNHIWQMGVHFRPDMAFAANPFALTLRSASWFPSGMTVPPWAAKFILAQDDEPNVIAASDRYLSFLWGHRLSLISTLLIEDAAQNIVDFAYRIRDEPTRGDPVPDNLKEAVERAKSLGATRVRIGDGKIDHMTDELEFEEEVELHCAPMVWGVDTLLPALEHATQINLSASPARWEGNGYKGVFSGMSG